MPLVSTVPRPMAAMSPPSILLHQNGAIPHSGPASWPGDLSESLRIKTRSLMYSITLCNLHFRYNIAGYAVFSMPTKIVPNKATAEVMCHLQATVFLFHFFLLMFLNKMNNLIIQ